MRWISTGGRVEFTPIWKTPTREVAVGILRTCRAWTDEVIADLTPKQRTVATALGDGTWSVKDLLGHLATHEHRALLATGARRPTPDDERPFTSVQDFNAHHLETKRTWTLRKVETDYTRTREELVAVIEAMGDDRWLEKIPHGSGRSALGLVLGKMLNGDKHGLFAHDFAHRRGLEAAAEALRSE
jgi:hypothetical protein